MRSQNASDVDRFQNTGFSNKNQSAIKKFFENLYEGISRVDWKVSIPSYRFLRNFFIAEISCPKASELSILKRNFTHYCHWYNHKNDKIRIHHLNTQQNAHLTHLGNRDFWSIKNGAVPRKSDQNGVKSRELVEILMCFNFDQHFWCQIKSYEALYLKIRQPK